MANRPYTQQTRDEFVPKTYKSSSAASISSNAMLGLAQSLNGLGNSIEAFGQAYQQQQNKLSDFNVSASFSDFTTKMSQALAEAERGTDGSDPDFQKTVLTAYDESARDYLKNVAPNQQPKVKVWIAQNRGQITGQAMKFQYAASDSYFKQTLSDQYQSALGTVTNDIGAFDSELKKLNENVDNSDLSELDKSALKRGFKVGLQGAYARGGVNSGLLNRQDLGIGGNDVFEDSITNKGAYEEAADKIIQAESGGKTDAKNPNSSATGLGQITEGTWKQLQKDHPEANLRDDGRTDAAQNRLATILLTEDNGKALASAGLPVTNETLYMAHFLGVGGAKAVLRSAGDTPLSQVLSPDQIAANKTQLAGLTVSGFKSMVGRLMSRSSAYVDPNLADMPFTARSELYDSIGKQQEQAQAKQRSLDILQQKNNYNESLNQIIGGQLDLVGVKQKWQQGDISGEQYLSLKNTYTEQHKAQVAAQQYSSAIMNGTMLDGSNADIKKSADSSFDAIGGYEKMRQHSQDVANYLSLAGVNTSVLPENAVNMLGTMVQSTNPEDQKYAANIVSNVTAQNPALAAQFPQRTLDMAQTYKTNAKFGLTPDQNEEVMATLRGKGTNYSFEQLDREAEANLSKAFKGNGYNTVFNEYDSFFSLSDVDSKAMSPAIKARIWEDYSDLYTDAYRMYRDDGMAKDWAIERLKTVWKKSDMGGKTYLTDTPITEAFQGIMNPDEIDQSIRQTAGLSADENYVLTSDNRTKQGMAEMAKGGVPSWNIFKLDENGYPTEQIMDPDAPGKPMRVYPDVNPAIRAERQYEQELADRDTLANQARALASKDARAYGLAATMYGAAQQAQVLGSKADKSLNQLEANLNAAKAKADASAAQAKKYADNAEPYHVYFDNSVKNLNVFISSNGSRFDIPDTSKLVANDISKFDANANAYRLAQTNPLRFSVSNFVRSAYPNGPMNTMMRDNPAGAKAVLNEYAKVNHLGSQFFGGLPLYQRSAMFDMTYAISQMDNVDLPQKYMDFINDPARNYRAPLQKLLTEIDPNDNPMATQKAIMMRLLKDNLRRSVNG